MKKDLEEQENKAMLKKLGKAKKDFEIHQNDVSLIIKENDDLDAIKIPEIYIQNLKTEGVL